MAQAEQFHRVELRADDEALAGAKEENGDGKGALNVAKEEDEDGDEVLEAAKEEDGDGNGALKAANDNGEGDEALKVAEEEDRNGDEALKVAKQEDGDGETSDSGELNDEKKEKTKEKEVDSPSRDKEKSSSFKDRDSLQDLKVNEKNRLSKLKEKVQKVLKISKGGDANETVEKKEPEVGGGGAKTEKNEEARTIDISSRSKAVEKSSSFNQEGRHKEESNMLSDLKDNEKRALFDLKVKVEKSIRRNKIFNMEQENSPRKEGDESILKEKAIEGAQRDVSLWGVPLLPSKGAESTNVVLLKFLQAREFNVDEAFVMMKNTLRWRKEHGIDSILGEDLGCDFNNFAYMDGVDREGHPVCYNVYGIFQEEELYQRTFVEEENCRRLFRWRVQMMEREIKTLNFEPGGVSSFLQISDLNNSPGPSRKELRQAMKQAVTLLQDNYPEFVANNVFINVPLWYYALYAFIAPFLTQRTKSKFAFARPGKVTETLLRYIAAEDIPICYGGLKRANDDEFSTESSEILELTVKAGSTETIELPAPEIGTILLWDLTVLNWEVHYKEEFVPTDEKSYTLIVRKGRKMSSAEEPIRNSFTNKEPGSVILTIENPTFKRKRVLYRYKTNTTNSSQVTD